MPLAPAFRRAAVARGVFPEGAPLSAAAAFALVRDLPYRRTSTPEPETAIEEWRGTCSSKHRLLQALLQELGHPSMLMVATHEFTPANSPWLPPHLLAGVERAPVPDVHNFLRVEADEDWFSVDATWPLAAGALGLPVNEHWVPGRNPRIAADVEEIYDVPEGVEPADAKARLLKRHAGPPGSATRDRRERFIDALSDWLASATDPPPPSV